MIESNEFDRGIHFALLQMQADLCNPASDGNRAAASHFMMMGAIEFVKTLRLLGEKPTPLTTMKPEHLDHKA